MSKVKSKVAILMIFALICVMVVPATSFAVTKKSYSFKILPHYANVQTSDGITRSDGISKYNQWGVNMTYSGEGEGALTDYWLERNNGTNVSPYVRAKAGNGMFKQNAYDSAAGTVVYLTAEDNKDKSAGYKVSGKWQAQTK